jgi:hypothetical protein
LPIRRSTSCRVDLTCCSAVRRFRRRARTTSFRWRVAFRWARLRAVAPRRSALRRFAVAWRRRRETSRRTPAWLPSGLSVSTTLSPPLTAAPTAVSATRCACRPKAFSLLACARARVSAALRAARLRLAAFCLRVAAAFWAAAFRCVSVCVAMMNPSFEGSLAVPRRVPLVTDNKRRPGPESRIAYGAFGGQGPGRRAQPDSAGWTSKRRNRGRNAVHPYLSTSRSPPVARSLPAPRGCRGARSVADRGP